MEESSCSGAYIISEHYEDNEFSIMIGTKTLDGAKQLCFEEFQIPLDEWIEIEGTNSEAWQRIVPEVTTLIQFIHIQGS